MLIRVYDEDLLDVVRICDESTRNGRDDDRKSTKMEKNHYKSFDDAPDFVTMYLLERGN